MLISKAGIPTILEKLAIFIIFLPYLVPLAVDLSVVKDKVVLSIDILDYAIPLIKKRNQDFSKK